MFISTSLRRKLLATTLVALGLVFFYEATAIDSRYTAPLFRQAEEPGIVKASAQAAGETRDPLRFTATAYCKGHTTKSGVAVRSGIAAADPDLLPVGSVIQIGNTLEEYTGIWTILDTGPKVHGRHVDLYVWSCHEALAFGRRPVQVSVLRLGWSPRNSTPSLIRSLFRQNEETLPPPPVWPPVAKVTDEGEGAAGEAVPAVEPAAGTGAPLPAVPALATPAPAVKKPGGGG
ncbi:MAG TPA: 3D domain-containing protein [Vicinamibacterales bacterium]|nr:3D domain-containing protein [Vicinamibacterales bacterium]